MWHLSLQKAALSTQVHQSSVLEAGLQEGPGFKMVASFWLFEGVREFCPLSMEEDPGGGNPVMLLAFHGCCGNKNITEISLNLT